MLQFSEWLMKLERANNKYKNAKKRILDLEIPAFLCEQQKNGCREKAEL